MDPAPGAPIEQPTSVPPPPAPRLGLAARVRAHPVVSGVVAVVVVAAAVVVGILVGSAGASGSLGGALDYAPSSAALVEFTDWSALGHSVGAQQGSRAAMGGSWLEYSQLVPQQVGVSFAESTWELFAFTPKGPCDIFQWPDGSGPSKIASGLVTGGWREQTSGSRITLTRDEPPTDDAWGWTVVALHFGIDTASHRVAQCTSADELPGALDGYGGGSLGAQPLIQSLTSAAGGGVSAEIRTTTGTCISPRTPAQPVTDSKFIASELVVANSAASGGTMALAYPSPAAASADLAARKAAFAAAQQRASLRALPQLKLASIGTDGPVIVARIDASAIQAGLLTADSADNVGLDDCGA